MIERHVTFQVIPGMGHDFEQFFIQSYRPALASMPGYIKADLLQESETKDTYQMVIRFENEMVAAAWRSSLQHENLKPRFKEFMTGSQLQVYQVVG